jgi:hypothetical protein
MKYKYLYIEAFLLAIFGMYFFRTHSISGFHKHDMVYVTTTDGKEYAARIIGINLLDIDFKELRWRGLIPNHFSINRSDIVRMSAYSPTSNQDLRY